jgi:pimeloyl-ACP methyl ester carboxylesterase
MAANYNRPKPIDPASRNHTQMGSRMKHSHIQSNGITLHVVELGEGAAVLFCHGFPDTWRGWRRQMEAVAAAGYRAISLDMRGYGESSAPDDPTQYTIFHTVGDLVGLLDALHLSSVIIVGNDFGASTAWNAALMRPDRFRAVFGISVPFRPRGDKSFLHALSEAGREDFYMFSRMRPEADAIWANAAVSFPANLYWSSAAAPPEERWTLFNRDLPKYRTLPEPLPDWADRLDIADAVADFQRTGFHGALNYYRSIQLGFDLSAPFKGKLIQQPSLFLVGEADGLNTIGGADSVEDMRKTLPGLIDQIVLPDVAHWPQLEASAETNQAVLSFLKRVD